jgi:hypothetical protein
MELWLRIACSNHVIRSRSSSAGNPSLSRKFLQDQTPSSEPGRVRRYPDFYPLNHHSWIRSEEPAHSSIVRLWARASHHPSLLCAAIKGLGIQVHLAQHLKYDKRHRQHDRANEQPDDSERLHAAQQREEDQ